MVPLVLTLNSDKQASNRCKATWDIQQLPELIFHSSEEVSALRDRPEKEAKVINTIIFIIGLQQRNLASPNVLAPNLLLS